VPARSDPADLEAERTRAEAATIETGLMVRRSVGNDFEWICW
jgi:hypothetical protein